MHIPMLVYVLVTAHLIGDWWLQSNWMALNKSKATNPLSAHVLVVGAALALFVGAWAHWTHGDQTVMLYVAVNMAAHWVTDFLTSRFNAKQWYVQAALGESFDHRRMAYLDFDEVKRFWFWCGIGTDQWIHYVTLFATAEWLLF